MAYLHSLPYRMGCADTTARNVYKVWPLLGASWFPASPLSPSGCGGSLLEASPYVDGELLVLLTMVSDLFEWQGLGSYSASTHLQQEPLMTMA